MMVVQFTSIKMVPCQIVISQTTLQKMVMQFLSVKATFPAVTLGIII